MLEWLFYAGHVTTATRRRSFERVYDLTERVIPPDILSLPDVPEAEAQAQLVALSARRSASPRRQNSATISASTL